MDSHILANASKFVNFLNRSPTQFHVVEQARQLLLNAGFIELKLAETWQTRPSGKYFTTKNESTLIAFRLGANYKPGNAFALVGAHTDSPCLKVKLNSRKEKLDYLQVRVECYGGGIWASWFDRDLTVAGRVLVKRAGQDRIEHRLVHINRPILKIPHLVRIDSFSNYNVHFNFNFKFAPPMSKIMLQKALTFIYFSFRYRNSHL